MVKTLLDRSMSQRLVQAPAAKVTVGVQEKPGAETNEAIHPPVPETSDEPSHQEFLTTAGRVSFDEGEPPVAFGQLLDTTKVQTAISDTGDIEPVSDEQF